MSGEKERIFVYKLVVDNGGAPCVENGLISLCICKPQIRETAQEGDWIIGRGGKSAPELKDRLIYSMKVGEVVCAKDYYSPGSEYKDRSDCIYKLLANGEFVRRDDAKYHLSDSDKERDLSSLKCLVGDCFAYFGGVGRGVEGIEDIYERLGQGHRVNYDPDTYKRLDNYIQSVFSRFGCGELGEPAHSDKSKKCSEVEDDSVEQCESGWRK